MSTGVFNASLHHASQRKNLRQRHNTKKHVHLCIYICKIYMFSPPKTKSDHQWILTFNKQVHKAKKEEVFD